MECSADQWNASVLLITFRAGLLLPLVPLLLLPLPQLAPPPPGPPPPLLLRLLLVVIVLQLPIVVLAGAAAAAAAAARQKRVQFSHVRVFSDSRNAQKSLTQIIYRGPLPSGGSGGGGGGGGGGLRLLTLLLCTAANSAQAK